MAKKKLEQVEEALPIVVTPQKAKRKAPEPKPKGSEKKPEPASDYARGYANGFKEGFKAGLESNANLINERRIGFDEGVRHIVTLAEDYLVGELGLPNREALAHSGKLPPWWIATLVTSLGR
jgi:hypothetical protein